MSNGSVLPPDIRQEIESRATRQSERGVGGVGGQASENVATARQRDLALNPEAVLREQLEKEPVAAEGAEGAEGIEKAEEVEEETSLCPNPVCGQMLKSSWSYCAGCGQALMRSAHLGRLGIKFDEDDLSNYLFKGYVVKELKLLGKHKVTVKSSQPKDMDAIDDFLMNGDWNKTKKGEERSVSDFYMRQMNSLCITAASVQKLDGVSIGETIAERVKWLNEKGSAFVDMVSQRAVWYNQALTEYLNDADTIRGS